MHRVFDETDLDKRKAAIADLWVEDGLFIDPVGVFRGHEAISTAVDGLHETIPGSLFTVTSAVQEQFGVGYVSWEYGPPGGDPVVKGIDVGSMKNGKLVTLYAFASLPPA
jgi:hypothetical protein